MLSMWAKIEFAQLVYLNCVPMDVLFSLCAITGKMHKVCKIYMHTFTSLVTVEGY